ncbi:hypothetical protein HYH02_003623 [Chlamydomonas schloesseri]|uniref:tRNA:m(4)X modification enzyme TRM13 n=1 Tax=Chlamydomonas schloesseri TaxID=2026947 RepID=A0A835WQX3_9CHLO|nr:hypothetical protein HYH02_003623 [Chlamydomonas schloesseri]|eukprot:KAG2451847.1 hypothetical protein HYH02_003623 [Chlamydomonas schloesseri]
MALPSQRYCGNHLHLDANATGVAAADAGKAKAARVPCPIDPTHTVLASDLEVHVKRCPALMIAQRERAQPHFLEDVNAGSDDEPTLPPPPPPPARQAPGCRPESIRGTDEQPDGPEAAAAAAVAAAAAADAGAGGPVGAGAGAGAAGAAACAQAEASVAGTARKAQPLGRHERHQGQQQQQQQQEEEDVREPEADWVPALGPFVKGRAAQRAALARRLGEASFLALIDKAGGGQVEAAFVAACGGVGPAAVVLRPAECEEMLSAPTDQRPFDLKHGLQQASILGNMQRVGLIEPGPQGGAGVAVVELGAGKGYLGGTLAGCAGVRRLVASDIVAGLRLKADRHLRHILFGRHRVDLKDYVPAATPELTVTRQPPPPQPPQAQQTAQGSQVRGEKEPTHRQQKHPHPSRPASGGGRGESPAAKRPALDPTPAPVSLQAHDGSISNGGTSVAAAAVTAPAAGKGTPPGPSPMESEHGADTAGAAAEAEAAAGAAATAAAPSAAPGGGAALQGAPAKQGAPAQQLKRGEVAAVAGVAAAEELPPADCWVAVAKHLCGAATDYGLRACLLPHDEPARRRRNGSVNPPSSSSSSSSNGAAQGLGGSQPQTGPSAAHPQPQAQALQHPHPPLRGLAIAPCCHHRCGWRAYTGKRLFRRLGFSPTEFELVSWMTGWALCGHDAPAGSAAAAAECGEAGCGEAEAGVEAEAAAAIVEVVEGGAQGSGAVGEQAQYARQEGLQQGQGQQQGRGQERAGVAPAPFDPATRLPRARRMAVGQMCKQLIDRGRLEWLRDKYARAELVCYIGPEVTGENRLLLAVEPRAAVL